MAKVKAKEREKEKEKVTSMANVRELYTVNTAGLNGKKAGRPYMGTKTMPATTLLRK